jgi:DNA-binding LacI/PurR family transcriptional regulator
MPAIPKHRELSQHLLAEITLGKYAAGERLPSEAQLVKRFGVSRPTVTRALRDLQAEGVIERRAGSGSYLRQAAPKTAPRHLGLLIPSLGTTEIFELICGELAGLARTSECTLLWGGSTSHTDHELSRDEALKLCDLFIDQRVMGVFFGPFDLAGDHAEVNREIAERFGKAGIPIVLLDRDMAPFPRRTPFDLVGVDNLAGGCLLAEHLIKLGCRRIAFVARALATPTINGRIAGVREALAEHGLSLPQEGIHVGDASDVKFVRAIVAGRWDAVIAANDLTAAHLLRSLEKLQVKVPADLRVVGFDDAKYATLLGVPLTTMRQPCRDIAITAFRALMDRIADPTLPARSFTLTPQLLIRESCGAYLPRADS